MLAFDFTHSNKSSDMKDVYKLYQMSRSGLKPINKRSNGKDKDLIKVFFKKFTTLLDD